MTSESECTQRGDFKINGEFMTKQILSNKLRVLMTRRVGDEPDPPHADFAGIGATDLDLLNIDIKVCIFSHSADLILPLRVLLLCVHERVVLALTIYISNLWYTCCSHVLGYTLGIHYYDSLSFLRSILFVDVDMMVRCSTTFTILRRDPCW